MKPFVIYAYTNGLLYPYLGSSLYSKLFKVALITDLRNPPYSSYIPQASPLYKRIGIKFVDYICLSSSSIIMHVSTSAKELIKKQQHFYNKSIVVPSCSSGKFSKHNSKHESKGMNFAIWSVINKPRKLDVVIKAFKHSQELNFDFDAKFFIIGDGDDLENLKELVKNLHIKNIIFKGYMRQNELFDFLNTYVSVSVIPIPPDNVYYSVSSPLKLSESISLHIPIIASNIQPNKTVKEHNIGILCEHSVEGYAKAFLEFWSYSELDLSVFRENCRPIEYMFKPEYIFKEIGNYIENQLTESKTDINL